MALYSNKLNPFDFLFLLLLYLFKKKAPEQTAGAMLIYKTFKKEDRKKLFEQGI